LSQHLALLREDGLVEARREAQAVLYSLAPGPAQRLLETLHGIYCSNPAATGNP
jgi:DNA-binding transcriptional ArsR family regulator